MLWPFGCFFTGGEGGPSAKKRAQVKKHEGIKAIGFSVRLLGCFGFFWGLGCVYESHVTFVWKLFLREL